MSKLTAENIWWPDCTQSQTQVVEGSSRHDRKLLYDCDHVYISTPGFQCCEHPPECHPPTGANGHVYTLTQTTERIIWACACGRTLSRIKYPREVWNS
jgi:hypothetical protein